MKVNPSKDLEILFLQDSTFEPYKYKLRDELLKNNVKSVFELRECGVYSPEYEINTEIFEPYYGGDEGFWFDEDMKWLIYVSHEDSITFAGGFVIDIVKEILPAYKKHLWCSSKLVTYPYSRS